MATYSFISVQATITGPGGSFNLGYGAGSSDEGISVEMIEDKDTMSIGADGAVMHSLHAGEGARATVRLQKTSPVNAQLSQLYNFQKDNPGNWGQNIIRVTDINRGDVETLSICAFARNTPITFGKEANMNEWAFLGRRNSLLGTGTQP